VTAADPKAAARAPRRRGKGRGDSARSAAQAFATLVARIARDPRVCCDGPPGAGLVELRLPLELLLRPEDPAAQELLAQTLQQQAQEQIRSASRSAPSVALGEAWCLRCRRQGCDHAAPPERGQVFAGYAPNGTPRWESFAALCLRDVPERAGLLYGPGASLVGIVRSGEALCRDLLPDFGSQSEGFQLLAQLDFGLLPLQGERIAASVQVLRLHPAGGRPRLSLHPVGFHPRELELDPADLEGLDPAPLLALLRSTRQRLEGLILRARGSGAEQGRSLAELAEGSLSRLKGGLERMARQRSRRTLHAAARSEQAERPLEGALGDAEAARDGDLYWDERRSTVVVLGPRSRVHVFSPRAQLVTSLKLDRDAVRRRVSRERWRLASAAEVEAFRAALRERIADGSGEAPGCGGGRSSL